MSLRRHLGCDTLPVRTTPSGFACHPSGGGEYAANVLLREVPSPFMEKGFRDEVALNTAKVLISSYLLPSSLFPLPSSLFLLPSSFFLLPSSFFKKMPQTYITTTTLDHVTTITFARPDKRNAFNNAMYLEVAEAIHQANESDDSRVIVLTGQGDFFCAGQDLAELKMPEADEELGFSKLFARLRQNRKPIIAAVNGPGVGLGLTLLLHTDINIVAEKSRFWLPFVDLAVVPEAASSYLLPRYFGMQKAAEILYTARWIEAKELAEVGLALETLPADKVLERAHAIAGVIAQKPPQSVQATRQLVREPLARDIAKALHREGEAFRLRLGSPEQQSAVARFFKS